MTDARLMLALSAVFAFAMNAGLPGSPGGSKAFAQSAAAPEGAAAAKRTAPPGKAEQALSRGIDAYKNNKHARAVGAFSSALSTGGLDTAGTARALYYRGLAYRKQGRSALAISDLTNALWLKNGLDDKERADALAARAGAYKAAGLADPGAPDAGGAAEVAVAATADSTTKTAGAADVVAVAAAADEPDAAKAATRRTPPLPSRNADDDAPAPVAARAAPEPAPAAPASQPGAASSNPLSGIGSFFSNLFSGSQAQQQQAGTRQPGPSDVTTASTGPQQPGGGGTAAVSSWNSATEVDAGTAQQRPSAKARRTAAVEPATAAAPPARETPPPAKATAAAPKGRFKLQVAAVRSRAEAEAIMQRFTAEHASRLGTRAAAIEEAVFGNMGTFYRVNVGPFASAAEPDKLCQSVRGSGYDCLVVTY